MKNQVKQKVTNDRIDYLTTLAELNEKQLQICNKLEKEIKHNEIDCEVKKVGDVYDITLIYDWQDLMNDRAVVRIHNQVPEFDFMRHEVQFLPFMRSRRDSTWKNPKCTADLFKMIEQDLYDYYTSKI